MARRHKTGGRTAGTPNKATAEIKALAREYGPSAIAKLAAMGGLVPDNPPADSETARVSALTQILDRAYGRPTQTIAGDDEAPLKTVIEVAWAGVPATKSEAGNR
jgi:hypothetical protein